MQELVVTHKFDLNSNMEEVQYSIAETIAKYDVVVVEDRLGEAKELMATFNKEKKAFSDKCKDFLKVISAPLEEFKAKQKEIEKMFDDGRAKIAAQVEKFEARKLETIGVLVRAYRNMNCESRLIGIDAVSVEDLIMLSAVSSNKSGYSLTKKTTDAIDQRIQAVELEILKAEKKAEEQRAELKKELEAEHKQEIAEAVESARNEERQRAQAAPKVEEPKPEPQPEPVITDDGKRVFVVTATFEVKAPANTPYERIMSALKNKMEAAGITTLKSIEVQ